MLIYGMLPVFTVIVNTASLLKPLSTATWRGAIPGKNAFFDPGHQKRRLLTAVPLGEAPCLHCRNAFVGDGSIKNFMPHCGKEKFVDLLCGDCKMQKRL